MTLAAMLCAAAAAATAVMPDGASQRLSRINGQARRRRALSVAGGNLAGTSTTRRAGQLHPTVPDAASPAPAHRRVVATVAIAGGGYVLLGGLVGMVAGAVLGCVAWVRLGKLEPAHVVRDREQMRTALPLAADLMAAALAAGCPPEHAVSAVGQALPGPLGHRLIAVAAALRVGTEPATAWAIIADEAPLRSLARAMVSTAKRGTSPVVALERIARDSEDVARWAAEARARSVGAKAAVPLGLCFLPAFILIGVVPLIATSLQLLS
jgi:Flp pilus assembly protein TadB